MKKSRPRPLLVATFLVLGLLPVSAAEKFTIGKGGQNVFAFSLLDVGIKSGIFARQGLELEVGEFAGGARMQQALASDSIDLGFAGGTDLAAIHKGAPAKAVAAIGGPPFDFAVTVRADGPIRTIADLKGKKIGVTTLASLTAWLTGEMSRQQGWGGDGVTRVAVGSMSASVALLRTGEIDGFTSDMGNALQLERVGNGRVLLQIGTVIKDFHTFMAFARNPVIRDRPGAVRAFLRGWFETVSYVRANKAASVKVIAEVLGHDPALIDKLYDQLTPGYSIDGRFLPDNMKGVARAMNEQFGVPESALPGLYTEEFLPNR
jgi:NitT/TauT family transport system substrate-binding protein